MTTKLSFSELLKRAKTEKIAVHTPTEAQAKALLKALDKKGYTWTFDGTKLTTETLYECYEEDTCYYFDSYKKVWYGSFNWYKNAGYTIVEFSEIDFEEE